MGWGEFDQMLLNFLLFLAIIVLNTVQPALFFAWVTFWIAGRNYVFWADWVNLSPGDTLTSQWQKSCFLRCFLTLGLPCWWDKRQHCVRSWNILTVCVYSGTVAAKPERSVSHTKNWNELLGLLLNNLAFKCVEVPVIFSFIISAFCVWSKNLLLPPNHEDTWICFLLESL